MSFPSISNAWRLLSGDSEFWKKWLIGTLLFCVPILNFVVIGYGIKLMRRHIYGQDSRLPRWKNYNAMWTNGLMYCLAFLVYAFLALAIFALMGSLIGLISVILGGRTMLWLILFFFLPVTLLMGLLGIAFIPIATARYAENNDFNAFFEWEWMFSKLKFRYKQWGQAYLKTLAVVIAALILLAIPAMFVSVLLLDNKPDFSDYFLFFLSLLPIAIPIKYIVMLIACHLFAQVYTDQSNTLDETLVVPQNSFMPTQPKPILEPQFPPPPVVPSSPSRSPANIPPKPLSNTLSITELPTEPASEQTSAPTPPTQGSRYCIHCGTANPQIAGFCAGCGKTITLH